MPVITGSYTAFDGHHRIASGPLETVTLAVKQAVEGRAVGPVLIFDNSSGRTLDVDTRGSDTEVLGRLANRRPGEPHVAKSHVTERHMADPRVTEPHTAEPRVAEPRPPEPRLAGPDVFAGATHTRDSSTRSTEPRGRGRPKLGVIAREVTLLPRHWEWLAAQPGGASVALRKLVEEARRTHAEKDRRREARERAYHFMSAIAGNMPGFEEAARALFANDQPRFQDMLASWPGDVRDHAIALAFADDAVS